MTSILISLFVRHLAKTLRMFRVSHGKNCEVGLCHCHVCVTHSFCTPFTLLQNALLSNSHIFVLLAWTFKLNSFLFLIPYQNSGLSLSQTHPLENQVFKYKFLLNMIIQSGKADRQIHAQIDTQIDLNLLFIITSWILFSKR